MKYIYKSLIFLILLLFSDNVFGQSFLGKELDYLVNGLKTLGYEYTIDDSSKETLGIVKRSYEQDGSVSEIKTYRFKKNTNPQICEQEETMVPFTEEGLGLYLKYFEKMGYENTDFVNFYEDPVYKSNDNNNGVPYYFTLAKINLGKNGKKEFFIIVEYYLNTSEFKTK